MSDTIRLLTARSVRLLDIAVAVWVVAWAVVGVLVWHDIQAQTGLSDSVVRIGGAVRQTGDALATLGAIPVVGGGIGDLADRVQRAGADVLATGRESGHGIRRTAAVAGVATLVLPATLVLLLYLPLRLSWRRDVMALRHALDADGLGPPVEHYLAQRAVDTLPWARLSEISDDPLGDIAAGRYRLLADAELARLGLRRP